MKVSSISSQLLSKLGSQESKIPLAAKDIFNTAGYTYFSYDAGGAVEGKDRLVDEVGTGALWLFGIPAYKKLIDKTIFKKAGISPEVDARVVKNSEYLKQAIKNAPTEKVLDELKTAGENAGKVKSLSIVKFGLALGLTMLSYFALTKAKHNMTKKNIEKEFLAKQVLEEKENSEKNTKNAKKGIIEVETPKIFEDFNRNSGKQNPSFGSGALVGLAEEFMFNPVKNMLLLDMGISTERLSGARTKGEFQEYAIKEGSFLFFVYGAGKAIATGINKAAEFIKHPIALDAKLLSSDISKEILEKKELQQEVKEFSDKFIKAGKINEMYDYIFKNQENIVVNAAKKSGIISTIKDAKGIEKIDTRKYIDPKKMKELTKNIEKFMEAGNSSGNIDSYLNKIKGLKVASTLLNVAICCLALGYIVPKAMYKHREKTQNGNNDFHVRTEYEKELKEKHMATPLKN